MTKRAKPNRPINPDEIAVVRSALEQCAEIPNAHKLIPKLSALRVVDQCQCGCPSVDFARSTSERTHPIADGVGATANGDSVGIIVWGTSDEIAGLEIYDLSADAGNLNLQDLKSIIPWNERDS